MGDEETKQLLDPVQVEIANGEASEDVVSETSQEDVREDVQLDPETRQMSFGLRMLKTCAMASMYVGLGSNIGVSGPSLLDLSGIFTNGNVEGLSTALSMRAIGTVIGSFLGAVLGDRFRSKADLFLFLIAFTNGLSCAATPWMPNVYVLGLMFFMQGLNHGTFNVACCSISIAVWGERAAAPIHALHMCYTLGYTLAQPIVGLFVVSTQNSTTAGPSFTEYLASGQNLHLVGPGGINGTANGTQIYIPYGAFGAYQVLLSFVFLAFFLLGLSYTSVTITTRKSFRKMLNPSSCSGGRGGYGVYMLISLFLLYIGIVSREAIIGLYTCTIGTMVFGMSGFKASLLGLAYNLSLLAGRIVGMFLAMCIRIQLMVLAELVIVLGLLVAIAIVGFQVELAFWFLICAAGFFMGPNYPSMMAWADRYIEATGFVVAIIDTGIGAGAFLATLIGGIMLENYGPRSLFYLCVAGAVYIIALFLPLQIVSSFQGDRHTRMKREAEGAADDDYSSYDIIDDPTESNQALSN